MAATAHTTQTAQSILVDRFVSGQGVDSVRALHYADEILRADEDIRQAALHWARTGDMPDSPVIEGRSPSDLAQMNSPSRAFSILIALRHDPALTLRRLRCGPRVPRSHPVGT